MSDRDLIPTLFVLREIPSDRYGVFGFRVVLWEAGQRAVVSAKRSVGR